ncbi:hypothetical protein ACFPVY_10525 [Flavobacterium qiangtangense]|uniref:Uncharacterized protein n=1 Tax=Flavobacterium qiangtangense TaxID=1442595 RepID=A0ABW1PPA1_9FLAO
METIRIQFNSELKGKLLDFLKSFSENELKIIQEDPFFEQNKEMLETELDKIENGNVEYKSIEELNLVLEKTISKYED